MFQQGREVIVAIVADRPGWDEGLLGRPFEDRAGLLLKKCLYLAGLKPADCLLTLLVRCGLTPPKAKEVKACAGWLAAELALVRPRVVVALGAASAASLTKNQDSFKVLTGPSHQTLVSGGRAAEAAMVDLLREAKELSCSGT